MKRIDEKIKEIEKKDKINRSLFIAFISLLAMGMAYVYISEKRDNKKDRIITQQELEKLAAYEELDSTHLALKNSLSPERYWEGVKKDNTVESYIAYITNDWEINKDDYLDLAIDKLKSNHVGSKEYQGWLYAGLNKRDGFEPKKDLIEIIYRKGVDVQNLKDSIIHIGDIVRLMKDRNQVTYDRKEFINGNKGHQNDNGWGLKTKAFVTDTFNVRDNAEFRIEIKYY